MGMDLGSSETSCAARIARFLKARGVSRVFGLQGGHIQPIWDWLGLLDLPIVDVRDEGAAVHMAHAHAELTGEIGVAMATAGPGVTNCVTAIANTSLARAPLLLIGGCPPRPQVNKGPLQDIPHVDILAPVTRQARTLRVADQVIREFDEALARASGMFGESGPVYLEIPTDVLRMEIPDQLVLDEWVEGHAHPPSPPPASSVTAAVEAVWSAKRPVVITGRGARKAPEPLRRFLDASGALYLDTQESRGLVPSDHPSVVGAVRGQAMAEADLLFVIGRKLDYQLAYGSPAVFPHARIVRLSDHAGELIDNRRGAPEILADPALTLDAMVEVAGNRQPALDESWADGLRTKQRQRTEPNRAAPALGDDGKIHPAKLFEAIRTVADENFVAVADGGDLLSFARVGLRTATYLDAGAFGCLGVGVPFAIAASLAFPERQVISINGDGAFGINAMEIDTAVRHGAKAVFVVSNNAAWNIERFDQEENYGGRVIGTTLRHADYAAMGRALGAYGDRIESPDDLEAGLKRAIANAPAVIDVVTTQRAVSSDATKGLGYVPDYQPLTAWNEAEKAFRGEG